MQGTNRLYHPDPNRMHGEAAERQHSEHNQQATAGHEARVKDRDTSNRTEQPAAQIGRARRTARFEDAAAHGDRAGNEFHRCNNTKKGIKENQTVKARRCVASFQANAMRRHELQQKRTKNGIK